MRYFFLFLFLLFSSSANQLFQQLSAPVEEGDLTFLQALNNYFGCRTWENGHCIQCSDHYVFNAMGICCEVTPQCEKFNRAVGICEQCYLGYEIFDGQCIVRELAQSIDRGCKTFHHRHCVACSARWYFNEEGVCQAIDEECRVWQEDGTCLSCYGGFELEGGSCVQKTFDVSTVDGFCAQWRGMVCQKCAHRAYFGKDGFCVPVSDDCRTWDGYDGYCLTCYKGYDLVDGRCQESSTKRQPASDVGCRRWDWEQQLCLECSARWVFTFDGVCVPVSDNCKHYDHFGHCIDCYKGYELDGVECVFADVEGPSDLGCKLWDWEYQICLQCSERWTMQAEKASCIPVSDQCKQYNEKGECTACYKGFELNEGGCELSDIGYEIEDKGCKIWDWDEKVCLQCSYRWFQGENGLCQPVSDYCKQYDRHSGQCTQCYSGYEVSNGGCTVRKEDYCQVRVDGVCQECYLGYRISEEGCLPANPLCKTSKPTGECLSCFNTYVLYKQICVPLVRLVNLAAKYAKCCPDKLAELKRSGRIV